jgi:hypothetical protein
MRMLPGIGIAWLCLSVALVLVVCLSLAERRPHFAARLVVLLLTPPTLVGLLVAAYELGVIGGETALVLLVAVLFGLLPGLMVAPELLFKTRSSSDGDGGGGSGSDHPRPAPSPPTGDVPLRRRSGCRARARSQRDLEPVAPSWPLSE